MKLPGQNGDGRSTMGQRVNIEQADFASNYYNACGSNDTGLKADLLLNEIADIVNTKPITVIQALSDCGYEFKGSTRIDLINAVAEQMHDNAKFRAALGILVSLNNGMITYPEIIAYSDAAYSDSGGEPKFYNDVTGIGSAIGGIGQLVGGITGIFSAKETAKGQEKAAAETGQAEVDVAKEQTKQALLASLAAKAEGATGASGTTLMIIGLLFLLAVGGGVWYFFFRTPNGAATVPAAATGGSMASVVK